MTATALHDRLTVIDGLIVSNWSRALFEAMREGGLSAANCTCSVWEGFEPSMRAIGQWKQWFREHDDIITQIYTVDDIARAKADGKVGVILGWQNSDGFGEDIRMVSVFRELGLRVVQLTYHTANAVGAGCLERIDRGLTDFGHELVDALNTEGILIDLSHVGTQTTLDAVQASKRPITFSHCAPKTLKDHLRNKTDEELLLVARKGGVIGVTMFPPFMSKGNESTLDDYLDVIDYVTNLCGEEHVAIGTDFTQDIPPERMRYFISYEGHGRRLLEPKGAIFPKDFSRIEQYPNLTARMENRGWPERRIVRLLGENWVRLFRDVWQRHA